MSGRPASGVRSAGRGAGEPDGRERERAINTKNVKLLRPRRGANARETYRTVLNDQWIHSPTVNVNRADFNIKALHNHPNRQNIYHNCKQHSPLRLKRFTARPAALATKLRRERQRSLPRHDRATNRPASSNQRATHPALARAPPRARRGPTARRDTAAAKQFSTMVRCRRPPGCRNPPTRHPPAPHPARTRAPRAGPRARRRPPQRRGSARAPRRRGLSCPRAFPDPRPRGPAATLAPAP